MIRNLLVKLLKKFTKFWHDNSPPLDQRPTLWKTYTPDKKISKSIRVNSVIHPWK